MGHQGGDAAILGESVRLAESYKERGEWSVFLTSPSSSPLLSSPPLLSSRPLLHFRSFTHPQILFSTRTFTPLVSLRSESLDEAHLGDFRSSPLHRLKCGKPVFYFSLSATFTNYYDQATLSLPHASVRLLGRPQ